MPESYSTTQAAKIVGVSGATIRNLTTGQFAEYYAGLFSAGARPGSGEARRLTPRDVLLLRFIRDSTRHGLPHSEIAAKIRGGALEGWEPPTEEAEPQEEPRRSSRAEAQPEGMQSAALVLASQVAQMLESYRSAEARLWDRIAEAEAAQAAAEARAQAAELELARVRRPWYRRLFGGA